MKVEDKVALWFTAGRMAGSIRPCRRTIAPWPQRSTEAGISVVIPSRNGKDLLAAQMPGIVRELAEIPSEIIVVDNGSSDHTDGWLAANWPQVRVEISRRALSFARAVNRGIAVGQYSHICLLNNDMILEAGFFRALQAAFEQVPDLFCATAQIHFPPGVRREETGKAVYFQPEPDDFPIRCDDPIPGEDLTYVLYGSGGCSLYDAAKLRALGSIDQAYDPVYVEDLDIGYRGWQRNWPTVYVARAAVEHRHRATSSRYYTEEQLDRILEINYLRFLARAVADEDVFRRLWAQALDRLCRRAGRLPAARKALRAAWRIALRGGAAERSEFSEELLLALSGGAIAVFPGQARFTGKLVASPDVRVESAEAGAVLVAFTDSLAPVAPELLAYFAEVVLVTRSGGPLAFQGTLQQTVRKWHPETAIMLGREMADYAADCAPAVAIIS